MREGMSNAQQPANTISRRQFLKITAVAGGLLACGRLLQTSLDYPDHTLRETRTLMGTVINLVVIAPERQAGCDAIKETFAEMERLIACFNHRQQGTALASLNQAGYLIMPPAELVAILERAIDYGNLTGGAFDVSVKPLLDAFKAGQTGEPSLRHLVNYRQIRVTPELISLGKPGMSLTLDGIAKGQVVDSATTVLQSRGFDRVLVEAGGDLVGLGTRADGRPWQVGIAHPRQAGVLGVLSLTARAMASSGDYLHAFSQDWRHHHIIDPRSGTSPTDLAGVTVLAPTATDADALSTALMVMGPEDGLSLIERLPHVEGLLVTKKMQIIRSSGFPKLT